MTSRSAYVLDSFALLALFRDEAGADAVEELLRAHRREDILLTIASVNLGEVVYSTEREFGLDRAREVLGRIVEYQVEVVDVDQDLALAGARHKAAFRMSYADCIAAALAQQLDAPLVTGDPDFHQVEHLVNIEWLLQDG